MKAEEIIETMIQSKENSDRISQYTEELIKKIRKTRQ